ncbi:MAG: hypothetical protein PW843_08515 [Azospirillaceae bacterium]|nr:hypothetical protein [Azospirillaceae bacterium]
MRGGTVTNMVFMVVAVALVAATLWFGALLTKLSRLGGAALFTHPRLPDPGAPPDGSGLRAVAYPAADGALLAAWAADPAGLTKPVILVLAGPGQRRADLADLAGAVTAAGYGVFLTCRRPSSLLPAGGEWGEAGLLSDARAALDHLTAQGFSGSRLVVLGVSAAAALAVQMAWERKPAALVLAAPPTSGADLLAAHWHLSFLAGVASNPLAVVKRLRAAPHTCPLLVLHGGFDRVVSPAMGQAVFQAAAHPKTLGIIPGAGHGDLWERGGIDALLDFLAGPRAKAETLEHAAPKRPPGLPVPRDRS